MIERHLASEIAVLLDEFPAVGLLGARQVGKTTLAQQIAQQRSQPFLYLDLESLADAFKLTEPESFFEAHKKQLLILDEVQRMEGLFSVLRGVIDRRRKEGFRTAQFPCWVRPRPMCCGNRQKALPAELLTPIWAD